MSGAGGVRVEIGRQAERVAVVTLDEPERRNVLSPSTVEAIVSAFEALEANASVGAVVVTGAGPAFCAGADLSHLAGAGGGAGEGGEGEARGEGGAGEARGEGGAGEARQGVRSIYDGFLRVARSPLPTVAAVNGPAVGAGVNLALCCDLILAAEGARFDTRFLQLGLHPGGGATWMLRRRLGPQGAAATALFGQVLSGQEAVEAGLAWRCVPDGELVGAASEMAARAAAAPPALVRRVKATLARMETVASHDEAVEIELEAQLWSMSQPEFAERVAAMRTRVGRRG